MRQYSDSTQSDQLEGLRKALEESRASEQELRATIKRQQLAVKAAEVGIWSWDLQSRQLIWSDQCKALFGLGPDQEISYERFLACLHPDDREKTDAIVQEAIREHKPYDCLYRTIWPDGSVRWLRAKGSLQNDEAGKSAYFQGIVIDFSAHKQTMQALEQEEQLFRTLANSIPQLAWMADKTGWIFWYNQRWYEYTGTTFEDMQGWGWRSLHHPDHVDGVVARFTQSLNVGEPWEDTFPLRGKDGQWRWFLSRALPIRDSEGRIARWFGTNTDITEQLQTQADLRESQERLQAALDASVTGTFRWDIRADALQGDNLKHLLGIESGDTPHHLDELIALVHPDHRDEVREQFEECAKTGSPLKVEFQVIWPDEIPHWLLCKGQRFFDERNRVRYITGACVDVTDRKKWEEALRASEEHLRDVLDSVTTFVGVMRPEGTLIEANSAALNIANLKAEQVLGKPIWDTYWFQYSPAVQEQLREAAARARDGQSSRFDIEAQTGENTFITVDFSLVPMFGANGKVNYLIPSGTDVTERKRMTERFAIAKAEADLANQAKSEFLASMSHELRTPLNAIIGYSEMLQEEAEDLHAAQMVPDLERVRLAGKHLLALVNDVLDLSKIEAGRMEVHPEEFALDEMLEAVLATARPLIEKNGSRFEVEVAPDLGFMRTDATKLRQILLNLLSNAAKFTEGGNVRLIVDRGEGTDMGQYLEFRVVDSGIGIAPEKLKQIFEPFTQADRAVSQKFGGTGLGLALSRRFARMMGGDIEVESELGQGSTFTVRVPVFFSQPRRGSSAETGGGEPRYSVQVLVIDDDLNTRDLLARSLAREGYSSAVAASGDEGLRLARELRPQLIILDVLMPGMDGWAVLASLKADAELCSIPVVVVSMVEQQNTAYVLGAADYIVKPLSRDQLRRLIDRFCLSGPKHLLIIDDDPDMRNLLRQSLEKEGCYVVETADGLAALESLKTQRPDLILLDWEMPRMDGLTFAHEIRMHEEWRAIPIVVITAKDLNAEERLKLKGYVQRIMEKGRCTRDELMTEVRKLLSRSVMTRHAV